MVLANGETMDVTDEIACEVLELFADVSRPLVPEYLDGHAFLFFVPKLPREVRARPVPRPGGLGWRARGFVDQHGNRYACMRDAEQRTGVKLNTIWKILSRRGRNSSKGYRFSYESEPSLA